MNAAKMVERLLYRSKCQPSGRGRTSDHPTVAPFARRKDGTPGFLASWLPSGYWKTMENCSGDHRRLLRRLLPYNMFTSSGACDQLFDDLGASKASAAAEFYLVDGIESYSGRVHTMLFNHAYTEIDQNRPPFYLQPVFYGFPTVL